MKKTLAFMLAVALGLSLVACGNNQSSSDGTSKDGQDTSIEYNADEFLPVGSVVLLKGGNKRIMICGRIQAQAGSDIIYDYSACYYPEGIIDPQSMFFFNRDANVSESRKQMISYEKQAVEYWQQAAEQGYAKAQYQLGHYYYNYGKNNNKNKKAFEWYIKAAEQGYALAQYELAFLYTYGLGAPMNRKMSSYWYEKAAEGGVASAADILGDRYSEANPPNYKKAIYWYTKAVELGYQSSAEYKIGWCYEKLGDFVHAVEWYRISANLGFPDANLWLKENGF